MSGADIFLVCVVVVVAVVTLRVGRWQGARRANQRWTAWTGITVRELEQRQFDHQLREFRRHIGRPVDEWPEQKRED